jgi:hypothetical protein
MKSKPIDYKGLQIFYADYSDYGRDLGALRAEVDAFDAMVEQHQNALVLVDIRNTVTSSEVVSLMKESTARTKGHVARTAVVGVSGIQRVLAQAVARFAREPLMLFHDVDAAKEWLAGAQPAGGRELAAE